VCLLLPAVLLLTQGCKVTTHGLAPGADRGYVQFKGGSLHGQQVDVYSREGSERKKLLSFGGIWGDRKLACSPGRHQLELQVENARCFIEPNVMKDMVTPVGATLSHFSNQAQPVRNGVVQSVSFRLDAIAGQPMAIEP
jgi:hypothetical protein